MTYIDVLIPAIVGLFLVLAPDAFAKSKGELATHESRGKKVRTVGFVLLGVAAIYLLIKLTSYR